MNSGGFGYQTLRERAADPAATAGDNGRAARMLMGLGHEFSVCVSKLLMAFHF